MNSEFTDDILEVVRKHYDISAIFTDEKVIEFVRSEFYVSDVFPDEVGKLIERVEELEDLLCVANSKLKDTKELEEALENTDKALREAYKFINRLQTDPEPN